MIELFTIPITSGANKGKILAYAPLKKKVKLMNATEDLTSIHNELAQIPDYPVAHISSDPNNFRTLMLLPNNKCNFHCAYCYSAKGRSSTEIRTEVLRKSLDWFISPDRLPGKKLTIIYIGGGEPLLSWPVVKSSIEYAVELNKKREGGLYISIVTNCSIINDDIIDTCLRTGAGICASYDILMDIQNKYRGHYDEVTQNINTYASRGIEVGITTVITEENIHRMAEMMSVMHSSIPTVKLVSFKPLVPDDNFTRFASKDDYYRLFVENFFDAKRHAEELGIRLTCPYLNAVSVLQDRFCEGKVVLAADGNITGCNFVSSVHEPRFEDFKIGQASEKGCDLEIERAKRVFSHNNTLDICEDCPAKYHCAGGCYAEHIYMSENDKKTYCNSMRLFLEHYLISELIV